MSKRWDDAMATLDEVLNRPAPSRVPGVKSLQLKAKSLVVDVDQGQFEAVISTEHVDRGKDRVQPEAMLRAFRMWTDAGKERIPLHWAHKTDPENIIGHINASTVKVENGEVHASGWVDQNTARGREVWRLIRGGAIGFSFGYLATRTEKNSDGTQSLLELDVFEVSVTPAPMNAHTRVLNWKATQTEPERQIPSREDLAEWEAQLFEDPETTQLRHEAYNDMLAQLQGVEPAA